MKYIITTLIIFSSYLSYAQVNYKWSVGVFGQRPIYTMSPEFQTYSTYSLPMTDTFQGAGLSLSYRFHGKRFAVEYTLQLRYGVTVPGFLPGSHPDYRYYASRSAIDTVQISLPKVKWGILSDHFITVFPNSLRLLNRTTKLGLGLGLVAVHPKHKLDYPIYNGRGTSYDEDGFSFIVPDLHLAMVRPFLQDRASANFRLMYHPRGFIQYYPNDRMISGTLSLLYNFDL